MDRIEFFKSINIDPINQICLFNKIMLCYNLIEGIRYDRIEIGINNSSIRFRLYNIDTLNVIYTNIYHIYNNDYKVEQIIIDNKIIDIIIY